MLNRVVVELTSEDIPGARLSEPLESHIVPSLRWWLLCRGITVPASVKAAVDQTVSTIKLTLLCFNFFITFCIHIIYIYIYCTNGLLSVEAYIENGV